jgi:hypothetical protein
MFYFVHLAAFSFVLTFYFYFPEIIADMVVQKLEQPPLNMVKAAVPANVTIGSSEPHTYILMTPDALTTPDKLLILIPGSQISLGQWSRRVMCDDNINEGSMISTSLKALEQGYQVIITNPNANYWSDNQSWVRVTSISCACLPYFLPFLFSDQKTWIKIYLYP